eukprot:RCo023576
MENGSSDRKTSPPPPISGDDEGPDSWEDADPNTLTLALTPEREKGGKKKGSGLRSRSGGSSGSDSPRTQRVYDKAFLLQFRAQPPNAKLAGLFPGHAPAAPPPVPALPAGTPGMGSPFMLSSQPGFPSHLPQSAPAGSQAGQAQPVAAVSAIKSKPVPTAPPVLSAFDPSAARPFANFSPGGGP